MQYCDICKIKVITKTDKCPLCHKPIKKDKNAHLSYPEYQPIKDNYDNFAKTISIIAPVLIVLALVLNVLLMSNSYFGVMSMSCIIYFWLLGLLTFNRKIHLGLKLIAHAVTISLVLIVINMFAANTVMVNDITWAISYAIPSIIFIFIVVINFILIQHRQKFKDYIIYLLSLCLIGLIPLMIVVSGVVRPLYPSVITAAYSYFAIIYIMGFYQKTIKEEFKKKFHI